MLWHLFTPSIEFFNSAVQIFSKIAHTPFDSSFPFSFGSHLWIPFALRLALWITLAGLIALAYKPIRFINPARKIKIKTSVY
jgi:hypothetical protein